MDIYAHYFWGKPLNIFYKREYYNKTQKTNYRKFLIDLIINIIKFEFENKTM